MEAKDILKKAVLNALTDRKAIKEQIDDFNEITGKDDSLNKHSELWLTYVKYTEVLQRSNEQLIKLADLANRLKDKGPSDEPTSEDEMYALLETVEGVEEE